MTIKLSELKAARAAMAHGPYRYHEESGRIEAPNGGPTPFISKSICEMYFRGAVRNATGIVATHNAADVLIEIVELELRIKRDGDELLRLEHGIRMQDECGAFGEESRPEMFTRAQELRRAIFKDKEAKRAALAKVTL